MINIPKIENNALKIQAAKQVYSKQIVPLNLDKFTNLNYATQDFPFKVLACQVKAMAEQDNMNIAGRNFNLFI